MLKRILIGACGAAALLAAPTPSFAGPTIGNVTLIDPATVHGGTVAIGPTLSYVSGGNGATGTADGTSFTSGGYTPAAALALADHVWAQYDPAILFSSATATSSLIAIPAQDHGWSPDNSIEGWEPFEFRIFGCTSPTSCLDAGVITDVWTRGVDDLSSAKNADDWTTRWAFSGSYSLFLLTSGDRLVGGGVPGHSPGEGEIDALALETPEPSTLALIGMTLLSLFGFGMMRRRNA